MDIIEAFLWFTVNMVKVQINCSVTTGRGTPANQNLKCHGSKVCSQYVTNNINGFTYVTQHFRLFLLVWVTITHSHPNPIKTSTNAGSSPPKHSDF